MLNNAEVKMSETYAIIIEYIVMTLAIMTVGLSSSVAKIAIVTIISFSFFFKRKERIVIDIFWHYAFYLLFKINGTGISYYNVIMIVAIFCLMKRERLLLKFEANKAILLFTICSYSFIITLVNGRIELFPVITDILIPFFLILAISSVQLERNIVNQIFVIYAVGIIISGVLGSNYINIPRLDSYIDNTALRMTGGVRIVRLQGLQGNPNYFSVDINLAITLLLIILNVCDQKYKFKLYILQGLLILLGIMTMSKSFLLTLVVTYAVYLAYKTLKEKRFNVLISAIIGIVIVYGTFYMLGAMDYFNVLLSRFNDMGETGAMTSGRFDIWLEYITYLITHPFDLMLGKGINADKLIVYNLPYPTHSLLLEMLYTVGVVGTTLYTAFFIKLFGSRKKCFLAIFPLMIFIVRSLAVNMLYREGLCIQIMLCVLAVQYFDYEKEGGIS